MANGFVKMAWLPAGMRSGDVIARLVIIIVIGSVISDQAFGLGIDTTTETK
jgi:hypothetical protein